MLAETGHEIAWARTRERLWLHTCTLDRPSALTSMSVPGSNRTS